MEVEPSKLSLELGVNTLSSVFVNCKTFSFPRINDSLFDAVARRRPEFTGHDMHFAVKDLVKFKLKFVAITLTLLVAGINPRRYTVTPWYKDFIFPFLTTVLSA